jgi:hypothetical protein
MLHLGAFVCVGSFLVKTSLPYLISCEEVENQVSIEEEVNHSFKPKPDAFGWQLKALQ